MIRFKFSGKVAFIILLLVFFTGCQKEVKYRVNFYHYLHVEEHEIDCMFCHGVMTEGMFAQADMDVCIECHEEEVDADEIRRDTCGKCHLDKDLDNIVLHDYERPTRGVFRHSEELSNSCQVCHINTVKEGSKKLVFWTRANVIEIRKKAHSLSSDCKICHENINKTTPWIGQQQTGSKHNGSYTTDDRPLCVLCHVEISRSKFQ
jgi:hypothetical protein